MRILHSLALIALTAFLATSMCFAQCGNVNHNSPYGINFHAPGGFQMSLLMNEVKTCGIGWIRVDFDWWTIETSKGTFDWSKHDAIVAAAEARGILIFATLAYTPEWATSGEIIVGVPDNPQDWYDFVYAAVHRYNGQQGKGLIIHWGLWNEPNLTGFWEGTREQYINIILNNGANAVKAANNNAKVVAPTLAHLSGGGRDWYYWLKDCIEQAGDKIDILAHNCYGNDYSHLRDRLDKSTMFGGSPSMWGTVNPSLKEVLQYCGWFGTGKPVWHTETGWETDKVGQSNQAQYYTQLLNDWFTGHPSRSWIQRVFFYRLNDHYGDTCSFGILSIDVGGTVTRKQSFDAYKNFITANPPAPIVPCAPGNPSPGNMASGVNIQATLSWTAGLGATSHKVYFGTTNPPPYVGNSPTGTTYNPGTMQQFTTYYWRIEAVNVAGGAMSNLWRFTTKDLQPPSVPTNVQAAAASAGAVQLTWNASTDNAGVTGYRIFRNSAQVGTSPTTSYLDTGLQPESTYSYTVSAYDAAGNHSDQSSPPAVATTPVDTTPPSVPQNVVATALSMSTVRVTWNASTDDVGVAGYRVYRDGTHIGTTSLPHYTESGLNPGDTYSYTVMAFDAAGNESAQSSPPAVVTTPSVPDFCSVDMGSADVNYYLSRVPVAGGSTSAVTVGGLNCRRPQNTDNQYFYFNIDDSYIYDGNVSTVYLEVSYFDDLSAPAFIEPQYDSAGGIYTSLPQVVLSGSNEWKIATWTLTDCKFANRQDGGADFRLYVGPNLVKIDTVRISKIPYSEHESVERRLGVNEAYWGLSHPQYAGDGNTGMAFTGGIYCRRAVHPSRYFYFNVSDAVLYDGSSPKVYLKVEYYDSPGGFIKPEYDSTNDAYKAAETLVFSGTNTWREHIWALNNVKYANRQNAGCDLRLDVGNDVLVYIGGVTISKVAFPDNEPPSVPTNVQATAQSCTTILVTWTASTDNIGVEGYKVFRDGIEIGTTDSTSFADTGLVPNTEYSYRVSAYDAWGNDSAQSCPAAVATTPSDTEPPSVPTNVEAAAQSYTSVLVTWTASTDNVGVAGYRVFRNGIEVWTTDDLSYTDTGLAPGAIYAYTISAYDAAGNESAQSYPPAVVQTPSDKEPPSVPTNVEAVAQSARSILVTWTASTSDVGVEGYKVFRDGTQVGLSSSTSYLDTGLTPGTTYSYTVSAYDVEHNDSMQSSPAVLATTPVCQEVTIYEERFDTNPFTSPARWYRESTKVTYNSASPKFIEQVNPGPGAGRYNWTWPITDFSTEGFSNVKVSFDYSVSGGDPGLAIKNITVFAKRPGDPDDPGWPCQWLYLDTAHYTNGIWQSKTLDIPQTAIKVAFLLRDEAGTQTLRFDDVKVTGCDVLAPSVPSGVQASAQSVSSIMVTWAASTDNVGVSGYIVYRNGSQVGTSATTSYTDADLSPGTTYSYTVSAYDAAGNTSAQSSPAAVATTLSPPVDDIAAAKQLPDGSAVTIVSCVVTAIFDGYLYVGEVDRFSGIRVVPAEMTGGIAVGDIVDVGGTLETVDGERQIGNAVVISAVM